VLNIYRAGYHPLDRKDVPFKSFPIPFSLINEDNKYATHRVSLSSNLGRTNIEINGSGKEHTVADLNLNPVGEGGNFIAFPVVAVIGFHAARGQSAALSDVEVRY
jgi:alpha-L-rhamnosidase